MPDSSTTVQSDLDAVVAGGSTAEAGTTSPESPVPPKRPADDDETRPTQSPPAQPAAEDAAPKPETETPKPESETHFWLRRGDQIFVGLLVAIGLVLMAVHWAYLSGWGLKPVEIERLPQRRFDFQLEINTATWVEWRQLEGIGDTLAHRIIDDRAQNGAFDSIHDLQRVKGIGPKTVERIRPWLRVNNSVPSRSGAAERREE